MRLIRTHINEGIKHLSGRDENDVISKFKTLDQKLKLIHSLYFSNDINREKITIDLINIDNKLASWELLRLAILDNHKKLINKIVQYEKLSFFDADPKQTILITLHLLKEAHDSDLIEKLLRREDVMENIDEKDYEKYEEWLHRKKMDKMRGDEIYDPRRSSVLGDETYESLLEACLNEEVLSDEPNIQKIKSIVDKIQNKNHTLKKFIKKFNETKNFKIKKYFASIIIVLVFSSFMSNLDTIGKTGISTLSYELAHKPALNLSSLYKIMHKDLIENPISIDTVKTSEEAKYFIKEHEKLHLAAYSIDDGKITIGWGHAEPEENSHYAIGEVISEKQAAYLFEKDIKRAENGVKEIFLQYRNEQAEKYEEIILTQNMFDAMVSMAFNMGVNGLNNTEFIELLKQKDYLAAAERIKTTKINSKFPGLINRRKEEAEIFSKDLNLEKFEKMKL